MSKRAKKVTKEVDVAAIDALFKQLADEDDAEVISMEGIAKLCEMLSVDPASDVRSLMLVWKLGAVEKPGQIQRGEFVEGMRNLNVSDVTGLVALLPSFDPGFLERSEFREFYRFVFQFSREGTHKTLEKDIVLALMPIVLDAARAPHMAQFLTFLQTCAHQRITLDQWDSFLQFNYSVAVDLSNWDENGAWPLLLDEFVDWKRKASA